MRRGYLKIANIIAGIMVICMAVVDLGMWLNIKTYETAKIECVVENHPLEYASADGVFDGTNSDNEERKEDFIEYNVQKSLFNILEIVPNEALGVIGYSVGGCEPVTNTTDSIMREATMDALINRAPGTNNANNKGNLYDNGDLYFISDKMREGGENESFTVTGGETYSGYYKFVGTGRGVYAIGKKSNGSYEIDKANKSAIMVSKFYPDAYPHVDSFDYIWEYSDDSQTNTTTDDLSFIYVKNHKRLKYVNNEKFLKDVFGLNTPAKVAEWKSTHTVQVVTKAPQDVTMQQIEAADLIVLNSGASMDYYKYAVNVYNMINNTSIERDNCRFSKTVDFKDFETVVRIYERVVVREDVALMASRNCVNGKTFDTNLRKLMCMLFYVNNKDANNNCGSGREVFMDYMKWYVDEPGSASTYDPHDGRVKTYYEIRQSYKNDDDDSNDEMFIAPGLRNDASRSNGYMHQTHPLVKSKNQSITGGQMSDDGYLQPEKNPDKAVTIEAKRPTKDMFEGDGIYRKSWANPDGYWEVSYPDDYSGTKYIYRVNMYESKSNATDYIYITRDGKFVRDTKYSGYWNELDDLFHDSTRAFKIVTWGGRNDDIWPWEVVESGCLKDWWFPKDITQGEHIPMYYDYYSFGPYRAVETASAGTYRNQSMVEENAPFKGSSLKDAVGARKTKREDDPTRTVATETVGKAYYCLSMNILNGDGVNKTTTSTNKNKVLYINSYELDANKPDYVPVKFRVRTSSELLRLELYKRVGNTDTLLETYNCSSTNDLTTNDVSKKLTFTGGANGVSLTRIRDDNEDGTPKAYTGPINEHNYVYAFEGEIEQDLIYNYYKKGSNNKFVLKAVIKPVPTKPEVVAEDTITIAVRDFFELN